MTQTPNPPQPHADPGIAIAEDGVVILDGPNGLAVTMTAEAAAKTGQRLMEAADIAGKQVRNRSA